MAGKSSCVFMCFDFHFKRMSLLFLCMLVFLCFCVHVVFAQKTGNAIRALGRMVTLSASRRNSGISSNGHSNASSPRPSIAAHPHLPSLDENRETKVKFETETSLMSCPLKNKNLKINNCERSDSGFSEVVEDPFEGRDIGECHKTIPPEILLQKLEEIAENNVDDKKSEILAKIPIVKTGVVQERTKKLTEKYEKPVVNNVVTTKKSQNDSKLVIPRDIPHQTKLPETTKNSNLIPPTNNSTIPTQTRLRSSYAPKKLVIQPNSKTALLRQKFENNCKANEQPHVRNFRTK